MNTKLLEIPKDVEGPMDEFSFLWDLRATTWMFGLPWLHSGKASCQCKRLRTHLWAGKIPWRRRWQPTPVFLPGKLHEQRSLAGKVHGITKEHNSTCRHENVLEIIQEKKKKKNTGGGREALCSVKSAILKLLFERIIKKKL